MLLIVLIKSNNLVAMSNDTDSQKIFLKQLGQNIKRIRLAKGLSQSELANSCGKERQSYQRVELGTVNPSVWYLKHIAVALDVDISSFFTKDMINPSL